MRESIFYSIVRAFFVAMFAVVGFCIGLVLLVAVIASLAGSASLADGSSEPESSFSQKTLANAEGVRKSMPKTAPVILQINVDGIIGAEDLNMDVVQRQLVESREGDLKDNRVKGILLHLNTPGGTVVDSDGIYRALKAYKAQYNVPVYAYVDGLCASGGMYIAAAADKIYSSDVSLIGSIGVLSPSFFNVTQLIDKLGIQALTITAGKDKDLMNPLRPWKTGEQEIVQNLINYYYNHFVDVITTNLPVNKEKLVQDYGAKVFNPVQAKEYGFISETGFSQRDALKELLKHLNITDDNYQVVALEHKTWFNELFKSSFSLLSGNVTHKIELPNELDPKLQSQFLYMYRP